MTFIARYKSWCRACEGTVKKGQVARYVGDDLVHDVCPDPTTQVRPLCPRCFMELPVNGKCSC